MFLKLTHLDLDVSDLLVYLLNFELNVNTVLQTFQSNTMNMVIILSDNTQLEQTEFDITSVLRSATDKLGYTRLC